MLLPFQVYILGGSADEEEKTTADVFDVVDEQITRASFTFESPGKDRFGDTILYIFHGL